MTQICLRHTRIVFASQKGFATKTQIKIWLKAKEEKKGKRKKDYTKSVNRSFKNYIVCDNLRFL